MFVEVVALHFQQHTMRCHNSNKHSQRPLTNIRSKVILIDCEEIGRENFVTYRLNMLKDVEFGFLFCFIKDYTFH